MVDIFLTKTDNRTEGMARIFDYYKSLFDEFQGKNIVIKPNFNTADPPPASTDITLIKELVTKLKDKNKITIVERSGPANTRETMETKGLFTLESELGGFDIIDLSQPETEWVLIENESTKHWKKGFLFSKAILDADAIIELACLKTHQFGGHFTLSLKLATGLVPRDGHEYMKELHSSPDQRKMIAEINHCFSPTLIILDGIDAFIDGGPAKGTLKHPNILLAGTDRIAIDAIGVAILRNLGTTPAVEEGSIFNQEQIARGVELQLGIQNASEINIVTDDPNNQPYIDLLVNLLNE
jgi:uncharacterized protein (DUF362 family)